MILGYTPLRGEMLLTKAWDVKPFASGLCVRRQRDLGSKGRGCQATCSSPGILRRQP